MDTFKQRFDNDCDALKFIYQYGWLRPQELGQLMWPNMVRSGYAHTCRAAQSWHKRGLILVRPLPDGAGRAFVLAAGGVHMLKDAGHDASSGKDVGRIADSRWSPPANWKHDLLAAGVLVRFQNRDWTVYPEATIRRRGDSLSKIPDGLLVKGDDVVWLEVEQARKSGQLILELGRALASVAAGQMLDVCGRRPNRAALAYAVDAQDERSHQLNHKLRVSTAIQKVSKQDTEIIWIACATKRSGLDSYVASVELVPVDAATKVLKVLDSCAWHERAGSVRSNFGELQVAIMPGDDNGYVYAIDDQQPFWAPDITSAKRGAASLIAAMSARH